MKIVVLGMHYSICENMGKWILRQSDLKDNPLEEFPGTDWVEFYSPPWGGETEDDDSYCYMSSIMHPEHKDFLSNKYDNIVLSIESQDVKTADEFIQENGLQDYTKVLVIRDFRNWLVNSGQLMISDDILTYHNHLSLINTSHDWTMVNYNAWHSSRDIRRAIAKQLRLEFTDCGINEQKQETWKDYVDNEEFNKVLSFAKQADDLSQAVFGRYEV